MSAAEILFYIASQVKRCYNNGKLYPLGVRDSALPPLEIHKKNKESIQGLILSGRARYNKSRKASNRPLKKRIMEAFCVWETKVLKIENDHNDSQ